MQLLYLYSGKAQPFGARGKPSAIHKHPIEQVQVSTLGIEGDEQGNPKVHGGPHKALHQFSLQTYQQIAEAFPEHQAALVAGALGENMVASDMHDEQVCIGDIYQLGELQLQVTSPRIPCWKIDEKVQVPALHKWMARQGLCGWYYRVLKGGVLATGAVFRLLARPNPEVNVLRCMQLASSSLQHTELLQLSIAAEGIAPGLREHLQKLA